MAGRALNSHERRACAARTLRVKARNPKVTPPRAIGGPTLLTGLAKCATCGGGMTLGTGKGGRYHYYACSSCAR